MHYGNMTVVQGQAIPALGLGTYELTGHEGADAVRAALDMGYRHIDTAIRYGNEAEVGQAIRDSGVPRADLFVTTKIWVTDLQPDQVATRTGESLDRLGLDHVDLLLIHWPSRDVPMGETLAAFADQQAAGRTRLIGVANFTVPLLSEALDVHGATLFCNQVEYHPFLSQQPLLDRMAQADMLLVAYQPIARGAVNQVPVLQQIGARHGKTPAQVTLRWLIQQDRVSAIPKSANPARLAENLDIFDFELSAPEMAAIFALAEGRRLTSPDFAPDWDA